MFYDARLLKQVIQCLKQKHKNKTSFLCTFSYTFTYWYYNENFPMNHKIDHYL